MRRVLRIVSLLLVALVALSIFGGFGVATLSRGAQPGWATWGAGTVSYDNRSVADGFLLATRFDAILWRATSFSVMPESDRADFRDFEAFLRRTGRVDRIAPPAWMMREADQGVQRCFQGSFGPIFGIWSWHWHTSERQPLVLGYPEMGVVRVLGVPLAYRPVLPGFLFGWAASYGLVWTACRAGKSVARHAVHLARRRLPQPGHCRGCGYDLAGIDSAVCPECGAGHV